MDNILRIAIIMGIIVIAITGLFVYYKMKKIDKEEEILDSDIVVEDRVNLDTLSNNKEIKNEELDTNNKEIDNTNSITIEHSMVKDDNSFKDIEEKKEDNTPKEEIVGNKAYTNKYISTSTLISPVGYYSGKVVRNNLINKRASKQDNNIEVNKNDTEHHDKIEVNNREEITNKEEKLDKKISFADMKEAYTKKNKASNYMEEITSKMAEYAEPKTITLTDYEQKQEDEAIISYQELLANRDKLFNISDEEEDEDFIEALKSFRENLN